MNDVTRACAVTLGFALAALLGGCDRGASADGAPSASVAAASLLSATSATHTLAASHSAQALTPSTSGTPEGWRVLRDGRRVIGLTDPKMSLEGAPIIRITPKAIFVDAEEVDATEPIARAGMRKVEGVFTSLKRRHDALREQQPTGDLPGVVVIDVEEDVPAVVVKAVFQTSAFAGYPNVGFVAKPRSPDGAASGEP